MATEEDEKEIEASRAPLISHLIELRSRLIKALLAFFIAAAACFFFAKPIYNILIWPYVWVAGPENSKFIYTALLEYFVTQLKLSLFGAAFSPAGLVAAGAAPCGGAAGAGGGGLQDSAIHDARTAGRTLRWPVRGRSRSASAPPAR